MPLIERTRFHEERARAVGGSDVPHLLGLEPYGCERRLWYEKSGVQPDFPFEGTRATRRGACLEEFAVKEFELATGMEAREVPWLVRPDRPYVGAHIDRTVFLPDDTRHSAGVLEVKCPSARNYYAMLRNGPSQEAQVQLQWGMMAWGMPWGCIWAFCADQWVGRRWDYDADHKMQEQLLKIADSFWATLRAPENPYHRLPREDRRCRQCPYRARCQGLGRAPDQGEIELPLDEEVVVEDESIFDDVAEVLALRRARSEADREYERAKDKLASRFQGPGAIRCSLGTARLSKVRRQAYAVPPTEYLALRVKVNPRADEAFHDAEVIEE